MAVLMILLTMPGPVRNSELLIVDGSTATIGAILKGSSSDKDSRELVGSIWLIMGALRCTMRIEHAPGETTQVTAPQGRWGLRQSWRREPY